MSERVCVCVCVCVCVWVGVWVGVCFICDLVLWGVPVRETIYPRPTA